jgi:hypothetical protein
VTSNKKIQVNNKRRKNRRTTSKKKRMRMPMINRTKMPMRTTMTMNNRKNNRIKIRRKIARRRIVMPSKARKRTLFLNLGHYNQNNSNSQISSQKYPVSASMSIISSVPSPHTEAQDIVPTCLLQPAVT